MTSGPARLLSGLFAAVAAVLLAAVFVSPASANNTRVEIANFQWSNKTPHIDLGESVLWDWTGPDTQHSITGQAPTTPDLGVGLTDDASQWDSDPDTNYPAHNPGDEYKVTFDHPGTYLFVCKVHQSVRGTVTVSNTPGDPNSDPGPKPPINFDDIPPVMDNYFFTRDGVYPSAPYIGNKGKGIAFSFQLNEGGIASVDYYRLVKRGKGKNARKVKFFGGYNEWGTHIGVNRVPFAARSKTFKPVPGEYVAYFRVEDKVSNSTKDTTLRFTIFGKKKKN